jgi:hypothetical protein
VASGPDTGTQRWDMKPSGSNLIDRSRSALSFEVRRRSRDDSWCTSFRSRCPGHLGRHERVRPATFDPRNCIPGVPSRLIFDRENDLLGNHQVPPMRSLPVFQVQARHSPKFGDVVGDQRQPVRTGGRHDQQVVGSDECVLSGQMRPDLAIFFGGRVVERDGGELLT